MSANEPRQRGTVVEKLPNLEYRVRLNTMGPDDWIRCYCAEKLRINSVTVLIGDEVDCVVPPGSSVGRIVFRHKNKIT